MNAARLKRILINSAGTGQPCGDSFIAAGETCHVGAGDASEKAVDRKVSKQWLATYPWDRSLRDVSDAILAQQQRSLPKLLNDMTEPQKAQAAANYRERLRRSLLAKDEVKQARANVMSDAQRVGRWPDGRMVPKEGDTVFQAIPGAFGSQAYVYGDVYKSGLSHRVKVTGGAAAFGIGAFPVGKTMPLTPHWTVKDDPEIARRALVSEAKAQALAKERDARAQEARQGVERSVAASIAQGHEPLNVGHLAGLQVGDEIHSHHGGATVVMKVTEFGSGPLGMEVYAATADEIAAGHGGGFIGTNFNYFTIKKR